MRKETLFLPILFSAMLAACAPTQTSRATGQVIDDASVTAKVKTEIAKTQGLGEAAAIDVDTYRGVVSLAGFVDNEEQIKAATQAASHVAGVDKVVNNLRLKKRP